LDNGSQLRLGIELLS